MARSGTGTTLELRHRDRGVDLGVVDLGSVLDMFMDSLRLFNQSVGRASDQCGEDRLPGWCGGAQSAEFVSQ